jgi:beta-mannanase
MPDYLLEEIALKCLEINQRGVPMLLRYGHEMNGDWTTYGNKPIDYVSGFRRMTNMIRKHTNMTGI